MDEQQFDALERRVAALESRDDIERMHNVYVRVLTSRQFDSLADYFTDDAVIDMRSHGVKTGKAAISEHFSHMVNAPLDGASYLVTAPVITVDGDEATGVWTWHRLYRAVPEAGVWEEGRYDCAYRRDSDGSWKFSRMKFRVVRPVHDDDKGSAAS